MHWRVKNFAKFFEKYLRQCFFFNKILDKILSKFLIESAQKWHVTFPHSVFLGERHLGWSVWSQFFTFSQFWRQLLGLYIESFKISCCWKRVLLERTITLKLYEVFVKRVTATRCIPLTQIIKTLAVHCVKNEVSH